MRKREELKILVSRLVVCLIVTVLTAMADVRKWEFNGRTWVSWKSGTTCQYIAPSVYLRAVEACRQSEKYGPLAMTAVLQKRCSLLFPSRERIESGARA